MVALSAVTIDCIAQRSPVANSMLRAVGVAKDWRTPIPAAQLDSAQYYYQLGYAELYADSFIGGDRFFDFDSQFARAEQADERFEKVLIRAPADSYAWSGRAWSAAIRGDVGVATFYLKRSWRLAPHSLDLAAERVMIAQSILYELLISGDLSVLSGDAVSVCRDVRIARKRMTESDLEEFAPGIVELCAKRRPPV